MPSHQNPKLDKISEVRGLGGSYLFGVDTVNHPGKVVAHFVRCQTIVFEREDYEELTLRTLNDIQREPRLELLHECFQNQRR